MTIGEEIAISIPGDPVPWARPIPTPRGGVTPEGQRARRITMQLYIRKAWGNRPAIPMGVPVAVEIVFSFKRPIKVKNLRYKATRPDIDNLGKLCLDALMGGHAPLILSDDGQVSMLTIVKVFGDEARTDIRVRILE